MGPWFWTKPYNPYNISIIRNLTRNPMLVPLLDAYQIYKYSHCPPSLVNLPPKSKRWKAKAPGNFFTGLPGTRTSPPLPFSRSPFEAAFRVPNFTSSLARNRGFRLRILPSPLSCCCLRTLAAIGALELHFTAQTNKNQRGSRSSISSR